jgi:hypothetical protein
MDKKAEEKFVNKSFVFFKVRLTELNSLLHGGNLTLQQGIDFENERKILLERLDHYKSLQAKSIN